METLDNSHHNGLSYSSSLKSTGTAAHVSVFTLSVFCLLFCNCISSIFIVCFKFYCIFFCCPFQISRSITHSMGKVGIPSYSYDVGSLLLTIWPFMLHYVCLPPPGIDVCHIQIQCGWITFKPNALT